MSYERPAKRIRQACEQCRRKKSKCSGEKPVCNTCWRLEQHCYYNGEPLQPVCDFGVNVNSMSMLPQTPALTRAHSPGNLVRPSHRNPPAGTDNNRVIAW